MGNQNQIKLLRTKTIRTNKEKMKKVIFTVMAVSADAAKITTGAICD